MVLLAVVKANHQSNRNEKISTSCDSKTPERILMKPRIYTVSYENIYAVLAVTGIYVVGF